MIVLGVILILVGYLLPVPAIIATIGWILLVIGVVLLILGQSGARSAGAAIGTDPPASFGSVQPGISAVSEGGVGCIGSRREADVGAQP